MKDCVTIQTENSMLPPNKRTNYAFGMVMDVDAFRQEQTHFEWKHALGNRLLHGYGTVCGLRVHSEADGSDVKILVEPGYAVDPHGRWIWVKEQLCARLNAWVNENQEANEDFVAPGTNQVFVTLCYDECPTDLVPIAGKACATDEDTRAPSRILETLQAGFAWDKPEQTSEDFSHQFGSLLAAVVLTDDSLDDESEFFLDRVAALGEAASPLTSPPLESPPFVGEIRLWQETACETIQEALVIWATEICPQLTPADEECILLACIDFDVDLGGRVLPDTVVVRNCDRPVLVPTRLQQELFCLFNQNATAMMSQSVTEADLTRIVALSWEHNQPNVVSLIHDGDMVNGLAVAFGKNEPGDDGLVLADTLDRNVIQVFGERIVDTGIVSQVRIIPDDVVPATVSISDGRIVSTETSGESAVSGVLLLFRDGVFDDLEITRLRIVIHGNFILDETGVRAIDAEFVRASLPTGDRPLGGRHGVQGGRFESWLHVLSAPLELVDINSASTDELVALPYIGPRRADLIVAERPFETVDDLVRIRGISAEMVDDLRGLIVAL